MSGAARVDILKRGTARRTPGYDVGGSMRQDTIEAAFGPFVAELRQGGFGQPVAGWPAELVAAHVARNNNLIAEAAERVAAGEQPAYDNAAAVDEANLRSYAAEVGGIPGLAQAIEASARRLSLARLALDETHRSYPLPVVIRDSGRVVEEGPVPIARFIEGNASFHLDIHLEQLRSLRPARETLRTADPPTELDAYELVLLRRPEARPRISDETAEVLQRQHLGHLANMTEAGYLNVVGPLEDQPDESWRGVCVYQVGSLEEARRLAELDPAVRAGQLSVEVMRWYTAKGALRWERNPH
jgi:uncharacterized protein YciI